MLNPTKLENEMLRLAKHNAEEVLALRIQCRDLKAELARERGLREYAERRISEWQERASKRCQEVE